MRLTFALLAGFWTITNVCCVMSSSMQLAMQAGPG